MKASLAGAGDSVRNRLIAAVAAGAGAKATAQAMGVPYRESLRLFVDRFRDYGGPVYVLNPDRSISEMIEDGLAS
jgi:hypothetical protein